MKSTVEEIRQRFDQEVERFANLETGQAATVDAPLAMALVAEAAAATTPHARDVLDVGCGAGNYTLKLLQSLPNFNVTLIDLSRPMLDKAVERVRQATTGKVTAIQSDIRQLELGDAKYDIILASAVLHHLRSDADWRAVFQAFHRALRPGGSLWIFDLIDSSIPAVRELMRRRYGDYLTRQKDEAYRDHVFAYIEKEDTPKPLLFQLDLLRRVGFTKVDVLHKNQCFAAFGGVKDSKPIELIEIDSEGHPMREFSLPESARTACAMMVQVYRKTGFQRPWIGYIAIQEGHAVGTCGFKTPPENGRVEIAYFTFPEFEGHGIATQMARLLIQIAHDSDPTVKLAAQTLPKENASTAILRRLGFQHVGMAQDEEAGDVWEWQLGDRI